jgi:hypothetical protein
LPHHGLEHFLQTLRVNSKVSIEALPQLVALQTQSGG